MPADPVWLAAAAGGLLAATLCLWALRGLPLGVAAFWLTPLPLFLAGIGFGPGAAAGAAGVAVLVILLAGSLPAVAIFLAGFGLPAALLVAAAGRIPGTPLGLPLALLGLLPAAGILGAGLVLADTPGGLEGALRAMAETGLRRFDVPDAGGLLAGIARVKAAAIGFWVGLALLLNAAFAARLLARAGLPPEPRLGLGTPGPAWSTARLPPWYGAFPALAFGLWLAAPAGADAVRLSLLLVLLVPLLLHGLAALHRRTRGLGERALLLGAVYVALVILFLPASLAVAGYGAYDLIRSSSPSQKGGGRGAPPAPRS